MDFRYDFDGRKRKNKKSIIFIIISFIIVIFIIAFLFKDSNNTFVNKTSNVIIYPIKVVSNTLNSLFKNIGIYFSDKKKVNEEKEELENEVKELKVKLLESNSVLEENESLKKLLDIKKTYQHFDVKYSRILYREHDNWSKTFTIDLGKNDGIKLNQAVVHKDGLVGYISKVNDSTSVVTTILDPSSSVSVVVSTSNEPAVLQGDLDLKSKNQLKLTFIQLDSEISIADMLYTSGLGTNYPNSIPVGKITKIVNSKNDINRYAIVEPCVDIKKISEVGVIIN